MNELINTKLEEIFIGPDLGIEFIKNSRSAVIAVNDKAVIVLVNRSAELMFGYHKAELLGQHIEVLLPDALKEKHKHHRDGFIHNPRNRPMGVGLELKAKRKNGEEISIDINLIPIPNESGMLTMAEIIRK